LILRFFVVGGVFLGARVGGKVLGAAVDGTVLVVVFGDAVVLHFLILTIVST
jgi:hypothetical protein